MVQSDLRTYLPSSTELSDSDDIPVDNVGRRTWRSLDQNLIPNVLLFLLNFIWTQRQDWYFGVDMGIYHSTGVHPRVPIVPDGFLSLGVERRKDGQSRRSYGSVKARYVELHSQSCRFSDSPQLALGFEPNVGLSFTTFPQ